MTVQDGPAVRQTTRMDLTPSARIKFNPNDAGARLLQKTDMGVAALAADFPWLDFSGTCRTQPIALQNQVITRVVDLSPQTPSGPPRRTRSVYIVANKPGAIPLL